MSKVPVIRLYRSIMRHVRALGDLEQRYALWNEARETFKANMKESDPHKLSDLWDRGQSRLAYVRTLIPPRYRPAEFKPQEHLVMIYGKDGKLLEEATDRESRKYAHRPITEEDIKRHHRLVDRFHFGGRD